MSDSDDIVHDKTDGTVRLSMYIVSFRYNAPTIVWRCAFVANHAGWYSCLVKECDLRTASWYRVEASPAVLVLVSLSAIASLVIAVVTKSAFFVTEEEEDDDGGDDDGAKKKDRCLFLSSNDDDDDDQAAGGTHPWHAKGRITARNTTRKKLRDLLIIVIV
mmetsp:Transcript_60328/g.148037  ORF Transcript_60328/g.148037 Transcript_60328/m.148037 type:complete len:161 (+) Transcript_60328:1181-1663(+)